MVLIIIYDKNMMKIINSFILWGNFLMKIHDDKQRWPKQSRNATRITEQNQSLKNKTQIVKWHLGCIIRKWKELDGTIDKWTCSEKKWSRTNKTLK